MRCALAVLIALALAAPAQARYLHKADGERAVAHWVIWWANQLGGSGGWQTGCVRKSAHKLRCSYTVADVHPGGTPDSWSWEGFARVTIDRAGRIHVRDPAFV